MSGPLEGVLVVELAAQGPAPFACMLLADLGADVVCIERVGAQRHPEDAHARGRRSVAVDLKDPRGSALVLRMVEGADALVEGYRPGVAERLGLGPEQCLGRNGRLVYGRMTGWGQGGPLAQSAGHDINYLALSGALHAIGERDGAPVPPLNLAGDYGGGGMLLALGVVAALLEARQSGRGQVVDAAMVDGLAAMLAPFHAMSARGAWAPERGSNLLDGGAHFYGTYRTSDGGWVAIGAIEAPFYRCLLELLGLDEADLGRQLDRNGWASARARLAEVFATRTRDEWTHHFAGHDACFTPVLDFGEARAHPQAQARDQFSCRDGVPQQAPAPRFSRTPLQLPPPRESLGDSTDAVLGRAGVESEIIHALRAEGVLA